MSHDGAALDDPALAGAAPDGAAPDEPALVLRVQRGDAGAFDVLVRRHAARALVVARRLLGDPDDAEDLVQDAFLRALDRIGSADGSRPFGPWFFRLLVNAGLNARKRRAVRAVEPLPPELAAPDGAHCAAERAEIRDRFAAALEQLPARQRLIVSLFEVDGLPATEIAAMLEVAPETVRWHLHQARRALRLALEPVRDR